MFVRLVHEYEFCTGESVPASHVNGPFSVNRPLRELQPGPAYLSVSVMENWHRSHTSIEPQRNLVGGIGICRRKEPEEKLSRFIWIVTNWQKTGVRFLTIN